MKRILLAFIAALVAAISLSGCFFVEREDHEHDRYRDRDRYQDNGHYHDYDRD